MFLTSFLWCCTICGSYPPLGELVDSLFGRSAAGLDHIEDSLLVRHKACHLAHHLPHKLHASTQALQQQLKKHTQDERKRLTQINI